MMAKKKADSYVEPKFRTLIYKNNTKNPFILFWNWGWNIYYDNPEIWNYIIVGLLTTLVAVIVKFGLLFTILDTTDALHIQIASVTSWIAAVLFAYVTNKIFVFKSKSKKYLKEFFNFTLGRVATLAGDMFIMWFVCTLLKLNTHGWVVIATLISQVFVTFTNYFISKIFVFKKGE